MEAESNEGQSAIHDHVPENTKKRKEYAKRSVAWDHFTAFFVDGKRKAKCKHCGHVYNCDSKQCGTTNLKNHMLVCKQMPGAQDSQSKLLNMSSFDEETGEGKTNLVAWNFDQKACRKAIVEMIIIDELPFKFIESEGFKKCMKICQPLLFVPSRTTIWRDCYELYLNEKAKLKAKIENSALRVCLTTDTWTSIQKINYMCLTVHFIDSDWKLHKRVLNFCPISSHKGEEIGKAIELCLVDWGLENVFTITVDNASSNDAVLDYLSGNIFSREKLCVLKAKWAHVRCMAHVLNLVVQDGIKELHGSVDKVRAAVRYVRQSPSRLKRFKEYANLEKINYGKSLCLDVPTRWNSTYLMLSVAIMYEKAFDRLAREDYVYRTDLAVARDGGTGGPGVPTHEDWDNMKRLVGFLRHFYQLTLRVSGTRYITYNTYVDSISGILSVLRECNTSQDEELRKMANKMKTKFDKYWTDVKKFNLLLSIAPLFDPRTKKPYLLLTLKEMYGTEKGLKVFDICEKELSTLFNEYKRIHVDNSSKNENSSRSETQSSQPDISFETSLFGNDDDAILRKKRMAEVEKKKEESGTTNGSKSELDRYLEEDIEEDVEHLKSADFTVLGWWKKRSPYFPILSLLARDILAIPVSTVASESTFSTGGRVLDAFRSSLALGTVQALICCQDWIRLSNNPINVAERFDDADKFEEDVRKALKESSVLDV